MKRVIRDWLLPPWLHPPVARRFSGLLRNRVPVFMLHRFEAPDRGTPGFDPATLRRHLTFLRREGYRFLSLTELLEAIHGDGPPLRRAVCFTVDDAYDDFIEVGAPVFREFDVPVGLFVPTGFVDGLYWPWWDKLEYVVMRTKRARLSLDLAVLGNGAEPEDAKRHRSLDLEWSGGTSTERVLALQTLVTALKPLAGDVPELSAQETGRQLEVELPGTPPPEYQPITWEQLRQARREGVTPAPHSVTHRNLAGCTPAEVRWEAAHSLARVQEETGPVPPIFAHPFGLNEHLGTHTSGALRGAGMSAALTAVPGYVRRRSPSPFELPRFGCPGEHGALARIVFGFERLRRLLPRWSRPGP